LTAPQIAGLDVKPVLLFCRDDNQCYKVLPRKWAGGGSSGILHTVMLWMDLHHVLRPHQDAYAYMGMMLCQ
jgi:hypothetical protein